MRSIALLIMLAWAQTPAPQTPAPEPKGTTPTECLKDVRDTAIKRQQEARAGHPVPQNVQEQIALNQTLGPVMQKISADRIAMAKTCAARFDVKTVDASELNSLVDLYIDAGQPELIKPAVDRALAIADAAPADRAATLAKAVTAILREPKSAERNARLETLVDELDALPNTFVDQQIAVHSMMNNFYRFDDIDAGIITHSTWLIDTGPTLTAEQRKRYGPMILSAYENMAEAWAGQGMNDKALALLRRAPKDWPEIPTAATRLQATLDRYLLVGTPAAPIEAARWLNMPAGASSLDMKGSVTLLEFTAHWCGPCKESYPGIKRLLDKYGSRGFRVVFATQLYGYFGTERNLTPEQEFDRDTEYFTKTEGFRVPIAVADPPQRATVNGAPQYVPEKNDAAYKVGGIPQIQLIDRQGKIRLIMIGYDDANEETLAKLIEGLLGEK